MADITISYKGNTIAEVSASGTTTLETAGKYCEDDITIVYVRPNVQTITDDSIYLHRLNPYNSNAKIVSKLVGCTYAWNQIAQFPNRSNITAKGITITVSDGVLTYSGTPTESTGYVEIASGTFANFNSGHKYLIRVVDSNSSSGNRLSYVVVNQPYTEVPTNTTNAPRYSLYSPTATPTYFYWRLSLVNLATDTQISGTAWVQAFDLTKMFGSTIANYIYGLGADACLAWFQNLFGKDYYPYDSGTLVSVKPTASKMTNADESSVSSYPLSGIELRGLPNLVNNALTYDGDEYLPDGTVTRKYGIRSYQSGDESLADAITDGTNTVYKLQSATAESANPYTARQTCYPNGTEEFVDGRTVEIPVNVVADYEVTS